MFLISWENIFKKLFFFLLRGCVVRFSVGRRVIKFLFFLPRIPFFFTKRRFDWRSFFYQWNKHWHAVIASINFETPPLYFVQFHNWTNRKWKFWFWSTEMSVGNSCISYTVFISYCSILRKFILGDFFFGSGQHIQIVIYEKLVSFSILDRHQFTIFE